MREARGAAAFEPLSPNSTMTATTTSGSPPRGPAKPVNQAWGRRGSSVFCEVPVLPKRRQFVRREAEAVPPSSTAAIPSRRVRSVWPLTRRSVSTGTSPAAFRWGRRAVPSPASAEKNCAMRSGVCELGPWPMDTFITSLGGGRAPKRFAYQSRPSGKVPARSPGRSMPVGREKPSRVPSLARASSPSRMPSW